MHSCTLRNVVMANTILKILYCFTGDKIYEGDFWYIIMPIEIKEGMYTW